MGQVVHILQERNIPHTFLLSSDALQWRLFLFPIRAFVKDDPLEIGPSYPELGGQMLIKRQEDYDAIGDGLATDVLHRLS